MPNWLAGHGCISSSYSVFHKIWTRLLFSDFIYCSYVVILMGSCDPFTSIFQCWTSTTTPPPPPQYFSVLNVYYPPPPPPPNNITSLEDEQTIIVFSVSVVTDSVWVSVPWLFIHPIYSFTLHITYSLWHDISQLSLVWYQFDWLEYKIKRQITTDVRCWDYQVHAAQQTIQTISICFKTVYKGWLNRERRLISKVDQETSILDPPESFHVIAWR